MKNKTRLLAILGVFALVVAACGDDGGSSGGDAAEGFTDLEGRTVTVGVENLYLPFNYIPLGETEVTALDASLVDPEQDRDPRTVAGLSKMLQRFSQRAEKAVAELDAVRRGSRRLTEEEKRRLRALGYVK